MRCSEGRLLVMARAPLAGQTKTRLIPALGAEGAATLQRFLVQRQLDEALASATSPVELWCAGDCGHPFFLDCQRRYGVSLHCQQGEGLGERLQYALASALQEAAFALVIGSDIPALAAGQLQAACEAMQQGAEAVLAPAEDGGYALLGVRQAPSLLFRDIDWGSAKVMAQTRERLRSLGWQWRELSAVWDVDRPEDLSRLLSLDALPEEIRRLLEQARV